MGGMRIADAPACQAYIALQVSPKMKLACPAMLNLLQESREEEAGKVKALAFASGLLWLLSGTH